jgi:hypothetical protein
VEHNPFKEWERVELKPSGHLAHRNAYMNLERVGWELDGHQVGHNPFKEWKKEWKLGGHPQNHNVYTNLERFGW